MGINGGRALLHAALEGFGIALGAEPLVRAGLAADHLVRVLPDHDGPSLPMRLIFANNRRLTLKLRRFVDAAVAEFGGQDGQERGIDAR